VSYSPQGLSELVANSVRQNPQMRVIVRADERATVKHFAAVTDICKRAGVGEAKIVYLSGGVQ
jgi:biopolymer transport protein ExbD